MKDLLIPQEDYERIFSTLYSILIGYNLRPVGQCIWFGIMGAMILKNHYDLNAKPVVGMAFYKLNNGSNDVLAFSEKGVCTENAFHCWTEIDGWIIDFMAPVFPEHLIENGSPFLCESRMMQKRLNEMDSSLNQLGDFWVKQSEPIQNQLFQEFSDKDPETAFNLALHWYKRPPNKMSSPVLCENKIFSLLEKKLIGMW